MAHFAEIDENNEVTRVLVVGNDDMLDGDGAESEAVGIAHLHAHHGDGPTYVQTSYNHNFRNRFAGIGMIYDAALDIFIGPQPYPSWVLQLEGGIQRWMPPVDHPDDGEEYDWNEDTQAWDHIDNGPPPESPAKPYPSWTGTAETGWVPPVDPPADAGPDRNYRWDEENQQWLDPA